MKTLIDTLNALFMKDNYFLDENGSLLKEKIKTSAVNHGYKMYINHGEKCTLL